VAAVNGFATEEVSCDGKRVAQGGHLFLNGGGMENGGYEKLKKGSGMIDGTCRSLRWLSE